MNAIPYENREEDWDRYDADDVGGDLPGRPRRSYLNKWSALLFAIILGGVGFYVGVRVEKGQLSSSSGTGSGLASAFASRFGSGASGTGTSATAASGTRSGATGTTGASGFASRLGAGGFGGFGAAGAGTVGTVSSVDGKTLYVEETSGNTVKVTLSSATKITKSETVSRAKVYPGDTVIIAGPSGKGGTVSATTVTDSGTRSTGSGTSTSGSGSSTSSSSGSAISSLFSGG